VPVFEFERERIEVKLPIALLVAEYVACSDIEEVSVKEDDAVY
jgi:hypothetical protein